MVADRGTLGRVGVVADGGERGRRPGDVECPMRG